MSLGCSLVEYAFPWSLFVRLNTELGCHRRPSIRTDTAEPSSSQIVCLIYIDSAEPASSHTVSSIQILQIHHRSRLSVSSIQILQSYQRTIIEGYLLQCLLYSHSAKPSNYYVRLSRLYRFCSIPSQQVVCSYLMITDSRGVKGLWGSCGRSICCAQNGVSARRRDLYS